MKRCLVYLDDKELKDSIDLLEVARQIYEGEAYETTGVTFSGKTESVRGAFDKVIQVTSAEISSFDPLAVTEVLVELQNVHGFDCILVPATPFGRMIAPRLAMRLKTGLVADVTAISRNGDELKVIRPAYSGRIMAGIQYIGDGPVMMSIRQGVFHADNPVEKTTLTETFTPSFVRDGKIQRLAVKQKEQIYDIRESDGFRRRRRDWQLQSIGTARQKTGWSGFGQPENSGSGPGAEKHPGRSVWQECQPEALYRAGHQWCDPACRGTETGGEHHLGQYQPGCTDLQPLRHRCRRRCGRFHRKTSHQTGSKKF
jgi:hypothetical protein